ncbi:MAG TPA: hypothetical protein VL068_11055, partial [Microthrixaceae bacterium]|nr:hypothetical protein [Microthrixaceae bacterium]
MSRRPHVAVTLTQRWHRVPGGTATSIERLVEAILKTDSADLIGIEPRGDLRRPRTMLANRPKSLGEIERQSPNSLSSGQASVPIARLPLPLPVLYDSWAKFGRPRISSFVDNLDLVHLTVPVTPPIEKVPLVATVHDLFPITHSELMTTRGSKLMRSGL